ncbi:hypothetical protein AcidC75_29200 [Acidisoma sp. C75]
MRELTDIDMQTSPEAETPPQARGLAEDGSGEGESDARARGRGSARRSSLARRYLRLIAQKAPNWTGLLKRQFRHFDACLSQYCAWDNLVQLRDGGWRLQRR